MFVSVVTLILTATAFQGQTSTDLPIQPLRSPQEVAAANPNLTDEMRGDIMMARKMFLEAIDFYKKGANDSPLMANKAGMAYHQIGDLNNAQKYYDKAIKIDKNYADAINNRGAVHYAKKSYWRATRDYEKALELDPMSATVWMNLGTAYFARKQYKEAYICYGNSLLLDPEIFERRGIGGVQIQERSVEEKAKFFYMLAKTYAQAGFGDHALRYIRFALENEFEEPELFMEESEFSFLAQDPEFVAMMAPVLGLDSPTSNPATPDANDQERPSL